MLRITKYGESILHQSGAAVTEFNESLIDLAESMLETMYQADGIGLAAQQIDKAMMLCVIDVSPGEENPEYSYLLDGKKPPIDLIMPMALVNPVIKSFSKEKDIYEEGCLSFPDIRGDVERPTSIEVDYDDLEGNRHTLQCDGIFARCIQHEVDHLNGILFTDRMHPKVLNPIKQAIRKLKKQTQQQSQ